MLLRRSFIALALAGIAAAPLAAAPALADDVVVFAAASLKNALDQVAASYKAETGKTIGRFVDEATAAGIALALATTTTTTNLDALLEPVLGSRWRNRFDAVVCGGDVARLKPAPDAYREALRRLDIEPAAALAFEDSANGIHSAQGAGLAVVATPTWYSRAARLPRALALLPHLGDPHAPLPAGMPGAPFVDLARLRAWHRGAAGQSRGTAACC